MGHKTLCMLLLYSDIKDTDQTFYLHSMFCILVADYFESYNISGYCVKYVARCNMVTKIKHRDSGNVLILLETHFYFA